jgi:L-threonylcarbamoyladenylate synthase
METLLLKDNQEDIKTAAQIINKGGIVAVPTETVYGLAANALDGRAVAKIFAAKGRPMDNPLIVHISSIDMIEKFSLFQKFTPQAKLLAEKFWPGPLTIILPKGKSIPNEVSAGLETVAVRFPSHPVAQKLIAAANTPLAAPSANLSGKPSPTKAQHCINDLTGKADAIIDGGECEVGVESTVITLATNPPRLLRPGGITPNQLKEVLGEIEIDSAVINKLEEGRKAASPGMKYKHYAPKAQVYLVKGSNFASYVNRISNQKTAVIAFDEDLPNIKAQSFSIGSAKDYSTQAHKIFDVLREIDKDNKIEMVFAPCPETHGVALAVYNRMIRAAAFRIINADAFVVGLTGPTGSGKSLACKTFEKFGFHIVDTDLLARKVLEKGSSGIEQIKSAFGDDVVTANGDLDRKLLAKRAFKDKESLEKLNSVTHPLIYEKALLEIQEYSEKGFDKFILDAPVLFESNGQRFCSKTLSVIAPYNVRMERIIKRDSLTEEEALLRINAQQPDDFYINQSDFCITNNGSEIELTEKITNLIGELKCQTKDEKEIP